MKTYEEYAMESNADALRFYSLDKLQTAVIEAQFVQSCVESGMIIALEADEKKDKKEGFFKGIIRRIKELFEKIKKKFKEKAMQRAEKYIPWIKENRDAIEKRAANVTIKCIPMWTFSNQSGSEAVKKMLNKAIANYKAGKYDDYKFAEDIIGDAEINSAEATTMVKNYLRTGQKKTAELKAKDVTGQELAKAVPGMFEYILQFHNTIEPSVVKLLDSTMRELETLERTSVNIDATAQGESCLYDPEYFISVEGCRVKDSILSSLVNYSYICEVIDDSEPKKEPPKPKVTDAQATNNDTPKSVTSAETVADNNKEEGGSTSGDPAKKYLVNITNFIKTVELAYMTALEERQTLYITVLRAIGGDKITQPTDPDKKEKPEK